MFSSSAKQSTVTEDKTNLSDYSLQTSKFSFNLSSRLQAKELWNNLEESCWNLYLSACLVSHENNAALLLLSIAFYHHVLENNKFLTNRKVYLKENVNFAMCERKYNGLMLKCILSLFAKQ